MQDKKIYVQIPCFNESENIAKVISDIRLNLDLHSITAFIVVIDDGSDDQTVEFAKKAGVDHVVMHKRNFGLAKSFQTGINWCLQQGADLIVNTDGDGQYPASGLHEIIIPILIGEADVVVGDRNTSMVRDFSFLKRLFQKLGTKTTNMLAGIKINDAASGFRAYSREAAAWIHITSSYTYTLESLVQLGEQPFKIISIETGRSLVTRPSRLFHSTWQYVLRNGFTLLRVWIQYKPMRFFGSLAIIFLLISTLLAVPFTLSYLVGTTSRHTELFISSGVLLVLTAIFIAIGIIGDGIRAQRIITQTISQQLRLKKADGSD
jgi:glycosyltransferase involved in cell wall biosynthesis